MVIPVSATAPFQVGHYIEAKELPGVVVRVDRARKPRGQPWQRLTVTTVAAPSAQLPAFELGRQFLTLSPWWQPHDH